MTLVPVLAVAGALAAQGEIVNDGRRLQPSVAFAKRPERIGDMPTYLKWKWRTDVSDPKSGLDAAALKRGVEAVIAEWKGKEPWPVVKARALGEEYFAAGGCGLNLNVQSVEELKDAQLHPEKYENLQVRVAGWNIRWNDIPKHEQDGFIRRLEAMPE